MNDFWLWFGTGMEHILDVNGYDHILFVSLLTLTFPLREWKKLLVLVTAFTVGHSVSLALSVSGTIRLHQPLVEFLIALSIFISAGYNLAYYKNSQPKTRALIYLLVVCFGLVHGLGFSYLLKSMLGTGQPMVLPLLYFNLGLELGQLVIVLFVLLFSLLLTVLFKIPFHIYKLITVCSIALIALKMTAERLPQLF
jgi:hypothetical protein